jgi:ABC-type antimicrobial peptide transport system permease subunit
MSVTAFPINDLLRRRLQTGLTVFSLTTCVASTLFLLSFSGQIGFGISATSQNTLTSGISRVFSQFLLFAGILIFVVGAVIVSFVVFLMMAQRTEDYGLMKATGCPNGLVFGYFLTELLGITFIGCALGVLLGFVADYVVINMPMFQVYNTVPNYWFAPLVFGIYFAFALALGAKPLLDAARMSPSKALSSVQYLGLGIGAPFKPLSKAALTIRMAARSLFRRKTTTVRVVVFLSVVFILLTVCVAGGIIANDTSGSWIRRATGENVLLVANNEMAAQYKQLLLTFSGVKTNSIFDYSNQNYGISQDSIQRISHLEGVTAVDTRLVLKGQIHEIPGFMVEPSTLATVTVGDNRQCQSLIVGLNPEKMVSDPFTYGQFLNSSSNIQAVVGDSISKAIYSSFKTRVGTQEQTIIGDALLESVRIQNATFKISGICIDPLNNGNVTYLLLNEMENLTNIFNPNILLLGVNSSNSASVVNELNALFQQNNENLTVENLSDVINENTAFLSSLWGVILFLPAFALISATTCLISYILISIDEQRQEFGIIRATGAKPRTIVSILTIQILTVLLSSFAVGVSLGIIICLIILTAEPVITTFAILIISGWLFVPLIAMLVISLYPAVKFGRRRLLEILL